MEKLIAKYWEGYKQAQIDFTNGVINASLVQRIVLAYRVIMKQGYYLKQYTKIQRSGSKGCG